MPPSTHSILPPSSAKSWSRCTSSVHLMKTCADHIPEDRGSIYAAEGSQAHDYAEQILTGKLDPADLPAQFAPVLEYTSRCQTLRNRWGGIDLVEAKVPLFYLPEQTGTVDFALLCEQGLFIRDLKYGAGVPVSAEENEQLAIYARSLIDDLSLMYEIHEELPVSLGIISPRYPGVEIEQLWTTTVAELRKFCEPIEQAAKDILLAINDPIAFIHAKRPLKYDPSVDNCRWCKAKAVCRFRYVQAFEAVDAAIIDDFEVLEDETAITIPTVDLMTEKQIVAIYRRRKELQAILDGVEKYLLEKAVTGSPAPGTKLVEGRQGNAAWTDEQAAAKALTGIVSEDNLYTRKIISPTKALEQVKDKDKEWVKAFKAKFTTRAPGKPVVATIDDPRPSIAAPTDAFATLEDNESNE